jgi:hypothetical protein
MGKRRPLNFHPDELAIGRFKGQKLEWDELLTPLKNTPLPSSRNWTPDQYREMDEKFCAAMRASLAQHS